MQLSGSQFFKITKSFPESHFINSFSPELPVTACVDPCPFYCFWHHQFYWSGTTLSTYLCRVKRCFKPYQNEHNSVKDTRDRGKKPCNIDLKISMKSCSTTHLPFLSSNSEILKAFLKTFPTKMKPTKCPAKKKKNRARKAKIEEKRESKIFLFVHAWPLQACIFHLDQKAAKCTTCKWFYGKF